jgi:hypothetical protein
MDDLLKLYSEIFHVTFLDRLGEGKDGEVFLTNTGTAIKFLKRLEHYNRELRAYRVLAELNLVRISGFNCPCLISHDETFLAIEMSIVQPPFIVDFVSAYTDDEIERFAFDEEVEAERQAFWIERFGDRWPKVNQIRDEFRRLTGLTLLDLSHNNIRFE